MVVDEWGGGLSGVEAQKARGPSGEGIGTVWGGLSGGCESESVGGVGDGPRLGVGAARHWWVGLVRLVQMVTLRRLKPLVGLVACDERHPI